MNNNTKFLTFFSLGGYFLIQLVTKSIGAPFSIIRSFFVNQFFNLSINLDVAAARTSTLNTVFYIVIVWFFLFTIKRNRDKGKANALKMLLYVILSLVTFLVIDLLITYIASLILKSGAITAYDISINLLLMISGILYMISLVAIVNEGKLTFGSITRLFKLKGFTVSLVVATLLRIIPQVLPFILKQINTNQYYTGIAVPLIISFVFMILIKPTLQENIF
ncbi:hypothetical protein IMX26_12270 [Clostridium sp. 'deep sea']|uniref:hypothetical protein n=1 Tax=Clostridium sp. 'deep sea' TaxID=2779445 RepID=UPI001896897A|nr:hypothetical protein [Clostridium sp. 'deep sea']QOR34262.1 hypothetical protein IMX26_12270 [Clostridium sp. 'deep sea']